MKRLNSGMRNSAVHWNRQNEKRHKQRTNNCSVRQRQVRKSSEKEKNIINDSFASNYNNRIDSGTASISHAYIQRNSFQPGDSDYQHGQPYGRKS